MFDGKKVIWAYGQYDSYSSLLLKVPEDHLNLIILANNNLMSDPARLIYGDGLSSLFALSFLKNYVFDFGDMPLLESESSMEKFQNTELYRKKLLAEALASSFMACFDDSELDKSKKLLQQVFRACLGFYKLFFHAPFCGQRTIWPLLKRPNRWPFPSGLLKFHQVAQLLSSILPHSAPKMVFTKIQSYNPKQALKWYPDYLAYADLNLLHNLTFIKDVHFHKDLGPFDEFDPQIEAIAHTLLEKDRNNPYVNIYMGMYHDRKGDLGKARFHFEAIANAKNFSPFWYTSEAKRWLEEHN